MDQFLGLVQNVMASFEHHGKVEVSIPVRLNFTT